MNKTFYRSHTCGELNKSHVDKSVVISGWMDSLRIQGRIGFLLLRDRYGITQCFLNPESAKKFQGLKKESVLQVKGKVNARPKNQINEKMSTGEIELEAQEIFVLNESDVLPLDLKKASEETRLTYRYLDLRQKNMQNNLILRHKLVKSIRDFLSDNNFIEIETPILSKSTPEGARDYLVPSRVHAGKFYALPQSPQQYKQLLMVAGFDKYFQIARCFRDEDLRADRQPEFTQLDMEMSFFQQEDVYDLIERLMKTIWKKVLGIDITIPFPRLTYEEAMKKYKKDNPDLRKKKNDYAFVWITGFPLLEYNKEDGRYYALHHPFTSPVAEDIDLLEKEPEKVRAHAYDLVLNGTEIGGGSIRMHRADWQKRVFSALGMSETEYKSKFGHMLEAFKYGAPPHGGIAFGLDRMAAIITGNESIREVIAFPKTKNAESLMENSPSSIEKEQLDELHLRIK
ncbi:aspartate--tRNA ligase [Candidatus Woesearchaeota archaeon]|nr:aspartate--tRNA ligase [Candidatus Woesearchaeota archaeon]